MGKIAYFALVYVSIRFGVNGHTQGSASLYLVIYDIFLIIACYAHVTATIVANIANATKKMMQRASHHPSIEDNVNNYPHCWTNKVAFLLTLV